MIFRTRQNQLDQNLLKQLLELFLKPEDTLQHGVAVVLCKVPDQSLQALKYVSVLAKFVHNTHARARVVASICALGQENSHLWQV